MVVRESMENGQVVLITTEPLDGGSAVRSVYFVAEEDPAKAEAIVAAMMAPNEKIRGDRPRKSLSKRSDRNPATFSKDDRTVWLLGSSTLGGVCGIGLVSDRARRRATAQRPLSNHLFQAVSGRNSAIRRRGERISSGKMPPSSVTAPPSTTRRCQGSVLQGGAGDSSCSRFVDSSTSMVNTSRTNLPIVSSRSAAR